MTTDGHILLLITYQLVCRIYIGIQLIINTRREDAKIIQLVRVPLRSRFAETFVYPSSPDNPYRIMT